EGEEMIPARDAPPNEARALQDPDVLGDRVERDRERRRDFGYPRVAGSEALEDAATGFVRERNQGVIEVHAPILTQMGELCKRLLQPLRDRDGAHVVA